MQIITPPVLELTPLQSRPPFHCNPVWFLGNPGIDHIQVDHIFVYCMGLSFCPVCWEQQVNWQLGPPPEHEKVWGVPHDH